MLHLRVISPADRTEEAAGLLERAVGVTNLVVLAGAGRMPRGDVLLCDVAREAANPVLQGLKDLGLDADGSIAVESVDLSLSEAAERAQREAPGDGDDAVVWEQFAGRVIEDCRITWAFLAFLTIATQLAAIGVIIPSLVVIVGAMVLGPEFGAIAAISFGLLTRRWRLVGTALRTLAVGFAVAVAITFVCALAVRGLGWIGPGTLGGHEEVEFIVKPDRWSFVVALLAGGAGVLSVTAGKSSALVGVFISVTTVPAAGYLAVAIALGRWGDVGGSVTQLAVNVAGMVIAGTVTLLVQRLLWARHHLPLPALRRRPGRPYGRRHPETPGGRVRS